MSNPAIEKVYIDTNILINYSLGKEKVGKEEHFAIAKKVFEDAINGNYKIAISNFLLSETLHALRQIATRSAYKELEGQLSQGQLINIANSGGFQSEINKESWNAFREIVEKVTSDPRHFVLETEKQTYSGALFQEGLNVLVTTFGDLRVFRYRCKRCDRYVECLNCMTNSEITYKGVNAPDLTHVSIAQVLGCSRFLTMDQYFDKISDKVDVKIEVLRVR